MKTEARRWLLTALDAVYQLLNRRLIFRASAQVAHERVTRLLRRLDRIHIVVALAGILRRVIFVEAPTAVGRAHISQRLILAAGFVKGDGFADESAALQALSDQQQNIIPGWRILPALAGPVEFGSFTRQPRLGNSSTVLWRNNETMSTQNRIGLRNPGARAAAQFLADRRGQLPAEYGINIALTPGLQDIEDQEREVDEALAFFLDARIHPTWFTLNISCPNTEDDPFANQLEAETRRLCGAFIRALRARGLETPLWVKISPGLGAGQYSALMRIFDELGVSAVIATNTFSKPVPDDASTQAGVGGGELFAQARSAIEHLGAAKAAGGYDVDIIACGGVLDGASLRAYQRLGAQAAQYWSALVFRGPFAAAIIESELEKHDYDYEAVHRQSLA